MPVYSISRRTLLLIVSVAVLALPSGTFAQTDTSKSAQPTATTATLRLRLRQADNFPVRGAEVTVKVGKIEKTARSDDNGMISAEGLTAGIVEIRIRRIGFAPAQLLARVALGDNEFTLNVDGATVLIDEVRVVGNRNVIGRLEDYELRLKRGEASSTITKEQIDKRNPISLSQMLRAMPGITLEDSLGFIIAVSGRGQKMMRNKLDNFLDKCVLRVAVDGVAQPVLTNIDAIKPKDIYGLEVFNGPARIPPQFNSARSDSWCGLIAIWTRG